MCQLSSEQWHALRQCSRLSATDKWIYQCLIDLHAGRPKALDYTTTAIGSYAVVPDTIVKQCLLHLIREKFLLVEDLDLPLSKTEWWTIQPLPISPEEKESEHYR